MKPWTAKAAFTREGARLLVVDADDRDLLKARIARPPCHPRALLTLLEGVAEWSGSRLSCVLSADADAFPLRDGDPLGGDLLIDGSALVRVEYAVPHVAGSRIGGLGDFARVRALEPWGMP